MSNVRCRRSSLVCLLALMASDGRIVYADPAAGYLTLVRRSTAERAKAAEHDANKLNEPQASAQTALVAPGLANAGQRYRVAVGAGAASDAESYAFDRTGAADVSASISVRRRWLVIDLAWKGRFGAHAVPLVTDTSTARAPTAERRHGVTLGAVWTGRLGRLGTIDVDFLAGLAFRHETLDRMLAPHSFGLAGPRVGVSLVRGAAALMSSMELGLPTYDSAPRALAAGSVRGRVAWTAGLEWEIAPSTRIALTYRGEQLNRVFSERRSNGAMVELMLDFGGGQPRAIRSVSKPNGVADCPTMAGEAANRECLDRDHYSDGVLDRGKRCSTVAAPREKAECRDADVDADLVSDRLEPCLHQPGSHDGCPDSDGDGIVDNLDQCPFEAEDKDGFRDEDGCLDPDNDADGLSDAQDRCPNQPEVINGVDDADGCPDRGDALVAISPDRLELFDSVQFRKAVIQKQSFNLLGQLGATLRMHPEILRLRITVHVQPTRDAEADQRLSQLRAVAIRKWLIEFGIAETRLKSRGFGGTQPLVDPEKRGAAKINERLDLIILERK